MIFSKSQKQVSIEKSYLLRKGKSIEHRSLDTFHRIQVIPFYSKKRRTIIAWYINFVFEGQDDFMVRCDTEDFRQKVANINQWAFDGKGEADLEDQRALQACTNCAKCLLNIFLGLSFTALWIGMWFGILSLSSNFEEII